MISWSRLSRAIDWYVQEGFEFIEVPWWVSSDITQLTIPKDRKPFSITPGMDLVGSAEQSFLSMAMSCTLNENKKFVACTPCFRDEPVLDELHRLAFMKVELFWYARASKSIKLSESLGSADLILGEFIRKAQSLFAWMGVATDELVVTSDKYTHEYQVDLVSKEGIELGSYGIHAKNGLIWVYGTGLAEPRFGQALNQTPMIKDLNFFNNHLPTLRISNKHEYVVIRDAEVKGFFDSIESAAEYAFKVLGYDRCLIRKID